jgi:hypothetical protein
MASPHPQDPEERPFPLAWEDDDTPGLSVHPLTQTDLDAILAHLRGQPDPNRPVQPGPPPASPPAPARHRRRPQGTPGASAEAQYRRRREVEHAAWTRTLPLRVAATAGAGLGGWLAATLPGLPLPARLAASLAAAAGVWWRLRFRPSPETRAWARGAAGERHVARLLDPLVEHGWAVHHDLRVPGSKANIDHLVIGPPGVFVVDAKHYSGHLRLSPQGQLWHGRALLAPTLGVTRWEADRLQAVIGAADIAVTPVVAVWGAAVPGGQVTVNHVTVVAARRLPALLRSLPPSLTSERAAAVAAQINRRLDARLGRTSRL